MPLSGSTRGVPVRAGSRAPRRPIAWLFLSGWLVLLASSACEDRPRSRAGGGIANDGPFIAFVGAGENDEVWAVLHAAAEQAGRVLGETRLVTAAPAEATQAAQDDVIKELRRPGLRALCVQVVDPTASEPLLTDVRASGVLVVTLVRPVPSSPPFNHCGLDDADVGRALAEGVVDVLRARGTIAILRAPESDTRYSQRYQAFRAELDRHHGITVLRELFCRGDPREARKTVQAFCERFPRVGGFVCLDDWPLRTTSSLSEPLVPDSCQLVTVNAPPVRWPLLVNGRCAVLIAGDYAAMAEQALQWCLIVTKDGELQAKSYGAGIRVVNRMNLTAWVEEWERWVDPESSVGRRRR